MARIWSMMDVGKRSLANSQTALQTISHNVASKNVEGFSRQRVDFQTNEPIGEGRLRIGMGARAGVVSRVSNGYLERQIEQEGNNLGYADTRTEMLSRVEQVFNEQVNKGLNQFMGEFFNTFRELSNNPESLASRTAVKESADYLTKDFQRIDKQLTEIQRDADFRIKTKIEEINQITKEISQLNEKVTVVELNGITANDERDRRDQLVKELSQKINIRYAEGDNGQLTITAGNTAVLVSGFTQRDLLSQATGATETKGEGNLDIFYKSTEHSSPFNVTKQIVGGELGGLLQVRDNVINGFKDNIDTLAQTITDEVNLAHTQGYDRHGNLGVEFFQTAGQKGAAASFKLNDEILEDVGKIAAAAEAGAPGDNRLANVISSIQYKQSFGEGTATIDDYYNTIVGKVGIEASRAVSAQASQKDIVNQLKNIRESISGVSLDEETTKMIEFQKTFDASARLIRTADEMMDTVLNLKRL